MFNKINGLDLFHFYILFHFIFIPYFTFNLLPRSSQRVFLKNISERTNNVTEIDINFSTDIKRIDMHCINVNRAMLDMGRETSNARERHR